MIGTADGRTGPIVINFAIFSEDELSVPFTVIKVPGLTIGGDIDPTNKTIGYVICCPVTPPSYVLTEYLHLTSQ